MFNLVSLTFDTTHTNNNNTYTIHYKVYISIYIISQVGVNHTIAKYPNHIDIPNSNRQYITSLMSMNENHLTRVKNRLNRDPYSILLCVIDLSGEQLLCIVKQSFQFEMVFFIL